MKTVKANFVELTRTRSKITLDHFLWGRQTFQCECLQLIDDDYRKGIIIKGREIYVYKKDIVKETDNMVSDGRMTICVTKL